MRRKFLYGREGGRGGRESAVGVEIVKEYEQVHMMVVDGVNTKDVMLDIQKPGFRDCDITRFTVLQFGPGHLFVHWARTFVI